MDLKKLQKIVVTALEDIKGAATSKCSTPASPPPFERIVICQRRLESPVKAFAPAVDERCAKPAEVLSVEGEDNGGGFWSTSVTSVVPPDATGGSRALQPRRALVGASGSQPQGGRRWRRRRGQRHGMKPSLPPSGHKMPDWAAETQRIYQAHACRAAAALPVVEIKPEPQGSKTREQLTAAEKSRITLAIAGCSRIIALDERGQVSTTQQLATPGALDAGRGHATFLISGADGLDPELKDRRRRDDSSLQPDPAPHAMARLVLCEQLYRAISVIRNHPYHREG